ncbi:hypothetical protein [Dietzia cinnamea]|uniref:hypothetical protein n=1 Tax=Dietzia cinnamea TaxID=321318 RepID=UPI00223BBD81|nr:hypothetical protein [Dietzia cinnamea]MCT2062220.1 hypothetical protein [Dietzia cinnamea]MCT2236600.1 hypothetical protein [Dietzia cinnamea]MCT2300104.1 hypothetical protein [Dietzia cinnamea]
MHSEPFIEPRCRICRDDEIRQQVNNLLARGLSYAAIVRAVDVGDEAVSVDSVRRHSDRHFPVQDAARATYREIIERRAREQQVDFVDGLGTALTPIAFLEAVVLKAHQQLVKDEVEVGVHAALTAAVKLQELASQSAENNSVADAMIQTDKIIRAVREIVPEDLWPAIVERLEAEDNHP